MAAKYPLINDLQDSMNSLGRRPLRTGLSSLGIGIGVVALIAMLSISEGARKLALQKIKSLGVTTLRIERVVTQRDTVNLDNLSQGLSTGGEKTIQTWIGDRGLVGGFSRRENVRVRLGDTKARATVLGVQPQWFLAEELQVATGRHLDSDDLLSYEKHCVIGAVLARTLHAGLESKILIGEEVYTVVGIARKKGRLLTEGTGLSTLNFDEAVYLPKTAFYYETTGKNDLSFDGIVIKMISGKVNNLSKMAAQLRDLLLEEHNGVKDFTIVVPHQLLEEAQASQKIYSLVMGAIAGLSLLVGGVGVLNVMLANIAEQTRDIGLRMAIGATRKRIISLYLCHAMLLSLSGAIWGLIVGGCISYIIQHYAGWPVALSPISLLVAPFAAIVTGLLFGLHPALRAARLHPSQALRDV